ncbi:hypothetical protein IJ732_00885, partial [bacterium]|nr:hypothetical protein [bacterium]
QGESEYCGTIDGGLDCGKYILTYHKLFDGLINNCTAYDNGQCSQCENGYQNNGNSCKDIRENTCDTYSGTTCTKCTNSNLLADGECIDSKTINCAETDGLSTCTKCSDGNVFKDNVSGNDCVAGKIIKSGDNETTAYKVGNKYVADIGFSGDQSDETFVWQNYTLPNYLERAKTVCSSKGMHLATETEMNEIYTNHSGESAVPSSGVYWIDGEHNVFDFNLGSAQASHNDWKSGSCTDNNAICGSDQSHYVDRGVTQTYCVAD